jgi:hypothetical protein
VYTEKQVSFWRRFTLAQDDERRLADHAAPPWRCGHRWYKAENIICFEHYRRLDTPNAKAEGA